MALFSEAYEAGLRPDVDDHVDMVAVTDAGEMLDLLESYLDHAPAPPNNPGAPPPAAEPVYHRLLGDLGVDPATGRASGPA